MTLPDIADELYGLPPAEFVAARDARAAQARKAGDRSLATDIKKLRRPTASAWLANVLVRHQRDQVEQLLRLGDALRDAQSQLAAADLRRLSQQRHAVVQALRGEAQNLADAAGQRVSDAVRQELEGTLEAALADPDAADALRAGRLTTALSYTGLGPGAPPTAAPRPPAAPRSPAAPQPPAPLSPASDQARSALAAAEGRARDEAARRRQAQDAWERAGAALAVLEEQVSRLRAERDQLKLELDAAVEASEDAERTAARARDRLDR